MAIKYLLDTNICIYITKQQPDSVLQKFEQLAVGDVGMSTITYGELRYGAQKSQYTEKTLKILDALASLILPLPIPTQASKHYDHIRHHLAKQGKPIGNNDLWIAAHALAIETTLVTHNVKEFSRVPQLQIENWVH